MGGSGASLGRRRSGRGVSVSPTSTGGKLVDQGGGMLYGENDNGYSTAVIDAGRDDINMYRYGSRQIYEVHYNSDTRVDVLPTDYVSTKAEARSMALAYLKSHK